MASMRCASLCAAHASDSLPAGGSSSSTVSIRRTRCAGFSAAPGSAISHRFATSAAFRASRSAAPADHARPPAGNLGADGVLTNVGRAIRQRLVSVPAPHLAHCGGQRVVALLERLIMKTSAAQAGSHRHPLYKTLRDPAIWAWLIVALLALVPAKVVLQAVLA